MYVSYVIGMLICILVLKNSLCAAQSLRIDGERQRGQYDVESKISSYRQCRDAGNTQFCQAMKPFCLREKNMNRQRRRLHYARKYCRKTCGFCSRQRSEKTKDTCVDRPICKRLTTFYKIEDCRKLPHPLRRRAIRKCPKLCKLCSPITEEPQVLTTSTTRSEKETTEAPKLSEVDENRPPHPPLDDDESDDKPRGGVFFIYTKYLSL